MTIREIAVQCGVSTATVDRVLNGRGKVRPDTEARVLAALENAGYTKNIAARALAIRKAAPVVGLVLSSVANPFFDEVLRGVAQAEAELADYGITLKVSQMRGYHPQRQLALISELEEEISALVLHPIDDPRIVDKVAELAEKGIPTVTMNTDLEGSRRCCYVGSDYEKGGRTAAGVMNLATQGKARLGILTGVETILGHRQRLHGFESSLLEHCPHIQIVAHDSARDDDESAYAATRAMLENDPQIDTLMLIAAGLKGVCEAIFDLKMEKRVRLFAFDNIPMTQAMLQNGLLKAVVCQQPFQQGYLSVRAAMDIILSGGPLYEKRIMENQIRILENLNE
jgi:LacI family transcriptional regulator